MFGATKPGGTAFGGFGTGPSTAPTFGFGTTPAATSTTGITAPQSTTGFQFGAAQPQAGFQLGGTQPGAFGQTQPTTGLAFGQTQPASSATFGQPQPTTGVAFGQTQPAASTTFGQAQSATSVSFGQTQPSTGLSFGATQPTTFGAALPSTGLSFGATPISAPGGLSFGASAVTTSTPSLFGSTPMPSLSFGGTSTTAAPAFGLGSVTSSAAPTSGFSFGQTTTQTTTPATASGMTLGTSAAPSFFGTPAATSAPSLNFGLGSTAPATGLTLGGGGLFGASTSLGLSTATSTTATVGLGGVDSAHSKSGLSGAGTAEPKHVKDHLLPDPLLQTFNDFQAFVKQQKSISVDISRSNSKPLKKVQEDIEMMETALANITSGLTRSAVATEKLKGETAQALCHVDMAQRLREAPTTLGNDNGPEQYFADLVSRFETDTARLQVQVEDAERHLRSITQSSAISPQELTLAMRRIHESLVVLAARVQTLHVQTQGAIEQYRYLRHVYLKEDMPVVSKPTTAWRRPTQRSLAGPTAFSETSGVANLSVDALSMLTGSVPTAPPTSTAGWYGSPTGNASVMGSLSSSFLSSPVDNSAGFQLSKPPVGNKRNKR